MAKKVRVKPGERVRIPLSELEYEFNEVAAREFNELAARHEKGENIGLAPITLTRVWLPMPCTFIFSTVYEGVQAGTESAKSKF